MAHSTSYLPRFREIIKHNNLTHNELPLDLQWLIEKFEVASSVLDKATLKDKKPHLEILAKTDAVISAKVVSLKNSNNQGKVEVNKLKLLSLKAKALKARMKLTS